MNLVSRAGLIGAVFCTSTLLALARQDPRPFETGTTAVVIDVVVRDARGRPVTDLTPADFEAAWGRDTSCYASSSPGAAKKSCARRRCP
jgi:hypothetical protein